MSLDAADAPDRLRRATAAIWPIRLVVVLIVERFIDYLTPDSPPYAGRPRWSPRSFHAKDEEGTLADCLRTVCAPDLPAT